MIKNKLKLSIAAGMLLSTCAYAGTVTAPNSKNIEISGDVELKMVSEKTGSQTIQKRTAEVNLGLESQLESGVKVVAGFRVFDGTQANNGAETFETTEAYAVVPLMEGGSLTAGLAENAVYGTDAFEDGGEDWKVALKLPVIENVSATLVSKVTKEDEKDKNEGDSGSTSFQVDAKVSEFTVGAKYTRAYENRNTVNETERNTATAFATGEISGVELGLEAVASSGDQRGVFITASKEIGALTAGVSYVNLTDGLKGGDDFALGMILDGNVDSSATDNTSAIAIPLEYKINDKLTANATLIKVELAGDSTTELDAGAAYTLDDNTEISFGVGKLNADKADDQTNIELAINIEF